MCRHLAYLGPPTTLAALVSTPPHGLLHQSYAPADMRGGGTVNADGFGVGWYPEQGADAVRYRSAAPIWSDAAFAELAGVTRTTAVLAAVRSATVGMPVTAGAAAPFAEGRWLFSHNGVVRGWPESVAALAAALPVTDLLTLDAPTDAALLWALVRHRLRAGKDPADALAGVVADVARRRPGLTAEPAAHRRRHDLGHRLGPRPLGARRRRASRSSRPNRSTPTPAGPGSPTDTSWWPAPASRHLTPLGSP